MIIEPKYKPCPFCGAEIMSIISEDNFNQLIEENGHAAVDIKCDCCDLEMWDFSDSHDYAERIELLRQKWNRRFDD